MPGQWWWSVSLVSCGQYEMSDDATWVMIVVKQFGDLRLGDGQQIELLDKHLDSAAPVPGNLICSICTSLVRRRSLKQNWVTCDEMCRHNCSTDDVTQRQFLRALIATRKRSKTRANAVGQVRTCNKGAQWTLAIIQLLLGQLSLASLWSR